MVSRHTLIYLLFFVVAGTVAVLGPRETHSASPADVPHIPEQALTALRDGRFLRASLILREYMSTHNDTTPSAVLLAALVIALGDVPLSRSRQRARGSS